MDSSDHPAHPASSEAARSIKQAGSDVERLFQAIFTSVSIGVALVDIQGCVRLANAATYRWLKHPFQALSDQDLPGLSDPSIVDESVAHKSLWELLPESLAEESMTRIKQVLSTGQPQRLEYALAYGQRQTWAEISMTKFSTDQVVWSIRDISDVKYLSLALGLSQEELRRCEQAHRLLFENHPQPLWIYDIETLAFLEVNNAAISKYGYSRDEFLAMTIADIRPEEDVPALIKMISQVTEGIDEAGIWRHQTKSGAILDVEIISHVLIFQGRRAELVLANDITARRQAEVQLFHSTLQDELTHLPNRKLLTRRLQALINREQHLAQPGYAVLFLDLDRFKLVNDSLGHFVGDQVLVLMAQKLQSIAREADVVARWGGDEFVILIEDVDPLKSAIRLAERLVADFQLPLRVREREIFLGTSVGIVIGQPGYQQAVDLLRDADIAMYQAKAQGRNHYQIFDEAMYISALERLQFESELHQAIQREELMLHYQPIVSLKTGLPVGLEALVRWKHPRQGIIGPGDVISIAEEVGLITAIDRWVLNEVCRQLKLWQQGPIINQQMRVAVNLSVQDFWNLQLIDEIDQILAANNIDGQHLCLEITESMLLSDSDTTIELLSLIRQRGIAISIDDFGTGYSSLSYLYRLPVNTLKIDQSFVSQMQTDYRNYKIVETLITLSHQLELDVIAEGIETEAQYLALHRLGCERGQGFWFSKPLPPDRVEAVLSNWQPTH